LAGEARGSVGLGPAARLGGQSESKRRGPVIRGGLGEGGRGGGELLSDPENGDAPLSRQLLMGGEDSSSRLCTYVYMYCMYMWGRRLSLRPRRPRSAEHRRPCKLYLDPPESHNVDVLCTCTVCTCPLFVVQGLSQLQVIDPANGALQVKPSETDLTCPRHSLSLPSINPPRLLLLLESFPKFTLSAAVRFAKPRRIGWTVESHFAKIK
jgi:hypothetical protein